MRTSEQLDKIAAALLKFQGMTEPPVKNSTADTGKFKYDYADLCSLFAHCKKAMIECGLVFTSAGLTSRILHTSGQWIEGDFSVPEGLLPQQMGSAMTYGRRYNFQGLLGINAEEDDDGAAAHPAKPTTAKEKPAPAREKAKERPDSATGTHDASGSAEQAPPVDTSDMELVAVKGFNPKPKPNARGGYSYGVVLETSGSEGEQWYTTFHKSCYEAAQTLKGKNALAKFEKNGDYTNLVQLVAADA